MQRSSELMTFMNTGLLVIDIQERLIPVIHEGTRLTWNVRRLLDAAKLFELPVAVTEQYPEKLGATLPELVEHLPTTRCFRTAKRTFSCDEVENLRSFLGSPASISMENTEDTALSRANAAPHLPLRNLLICGVETHICVQQTALDLLAAGWRVFLATDAIGSRFPHDHEVALRRMEAAGVVLTTTEATMFEWCQTSLAPQFREVSRLARETLGHHEN
ncbi:MAG: hydrolase [Thermoguttaceae bacterium]|nr:hydrolase [Thermoguttaceae bacterium]